MNRCGWPDTRPTIGRSGSGSSTGRLDLGCVAAHGVFGCDDTGCGVITRMDKPATAFLFELIARLQEQATVPMIDIRAYGRWLARSF